MKSREGFVSNSSSSSFVIFYKGKNLKADIAKAFELPESYPIKELNFSEAFCSAIKKENPITTQKEYEEYRDDYGYDDIDKEELAMINDGFTMYRGSFYTDSDPIECFLAESPAFYDSDILKIKGEE